MTKIDRAPPLLRLLLDRFEAAVKRNIVIFMLKQRRKRLSNYAFDQLRFGTSPAPSLIVTSLLAGICLNVSCNPLGQ